METLTRKQLSKLLVYDDDVKTLAERDSYPGHTLSGRCRSEKKQESKKVIDKKNKSGSSNANGTGMIQKKKNEKSKKEKVVSDESGSSNAIDKKSKYGF